MQRGTKKATTLSSPFNPFSSVFDFPPGSSGAGDGMYDYNNSIAPSTFDHCGNIPGTRFCSPPPPPPFVPSAYGLAPAPAGAPNGQQFVQQRFYSNHHLINGGPGPSPASGPQVYITNGCGLLSPNLPQNANNSAPCNPNAATNIASHLAMNHIQPQMHLSPPNGGPAMFLQPPPQQHQMQRTMNVVPNMPFAAGHGQQGHLLPQHQFMQQQQECMPQPPSSLSSGPFMCCPPGEAMGALPPGVFYRNRIPGVPQPPPPPPLQYFGLDYKIYDLNKRLQHRSEVSDLLVLLM